MGFDAATGGTQRMLDVQHFVEEHVFHGIARHRGAIEPAVHHDLIERRIETAELGAPGAAAPAEPGTMQASAEIPPVEPGEHRREIVNRAVRSALDAPAASAAKFGDAAARAG